MIMTIPSHIQAVVDKIYNETNPICVFLYGSMSRGDNNNESDYEIGVLYNKVSKVPRSTLAKFHNFTELKFYPFTIEDLQSFNLDTPFPKKLYILGLVTNAKILKGQDVFKDITLQKINNEDLIELVAFSLGRAYCAVVSSRQNDVLAVTENFTKSVFYGLQGLVYAKTNKLIHSYREIQSLIPDLQIPDEYSELINHAFAVRFNGEQINNGLLYTNISFLNMFIMPLVKNYSNA